jgi:hypothetical protein
MLRGLEAKSIAAEMSSQSGAAEAISIPVEP